MPKDYYLVLGVSKGVDLHKIKKAYRMVVKKYHPDVAASGESSEKFLEIKEAYEILTDAKKREQYDQELARQQSAVRISNAPELIKERTSAFNQLDSFSSAVDEFLDGFLPGFFGDYFDKGRGKALFLEVILAPDEAARGGLFPITVPVLEPCPQCWKAGFWEDFFCPVCYGRGRVKSQRQFSLSIPPHVVHGSKIRLSLEDVGLRNVSLNIKITIDRSSEELWQEFLQLQIVAHQCSQGYVEQNSMIC